MDCSFICEQLPTVGFQCAACKCEQKSTACTAGACACVCVTKSSTVCVPRYVVPFHVYYLFAFKRGRKPTKHKFTIRTISKNTVP